MKNTDSIYKKWWFWILALIAFIFVLIFLFIGSAVVAAILETFGVSFSNSSNDVAHPITQEIQEIQENEKIEKTTLDKLYDNFRSLNIKHSDLHIYQDDPDNPQYIIRYSANNSFWDENDFIIDCISNYVKLCNEPYLSNEADKIEMIVYCDLTDARGNKNEAKAFDICMLKDSYKKYDWNNLQYFLVNYDLLTSDCETLYIHPGIKKNVKFDKLYYR